MSASGSIDAAFAHAGTSLAPPPPSAGADDSAAGVAARIPRLRDGPDDMRLTPLRAHYLKKTLLSLQVEREIKSLSQKDALSTFGPPFHASASVSRADVPVLRFLFHHFILTFPFLRSAPANFWGDKVQVFVSRFLERNISGTTPEEGEVSKRTRLGTKIGKWVTLLMGAAIHANSAEEILSIAPADRERMTAAQARMRAALAGAPPPDTGFDVNVVGVRSVSTKAGRLARTRTHDEFLLRTRREGMPDVYVSRRYGDFARLADTLRVEFPGEDLGRPPAKDRRGTQWAGTQSMGQHEAQNGSPEQQLADLHIGTSAPHPGAPLAREKNRLTLRAYVRSLLAIPSVADSGALSDFLLGEPTRLTPDEEADITAREALDAVREDEAGRFAAEASRRVGELREHIAEFKAQLVQRDGLSQVFGTIKRTPLIEDLPESYRALLAWGRISAASTLFHLFMGSDTSSDLFGQLKRIHGLMPYFMLRGILRISNPVYMVRSVLDLFLARPFGQTSLLQRMFTSSLQEEVKELETMALGVRAKIEDDDLCERVRAFVHSPHEYQSALKRQARAERLDMLTVILRSPPEGTPPLARPQVHRVVRASRAYELYKEYRANLGRGEEDQGPDAVDAEAWLYEDLHVYLRCMTRLRDKEQMISLVFEGVTSELLKDIVTIFYSPLAQVYKAANIADSLSDLQAFITDLIRTVESSEELSYTDPQRTVQVFIDLVQRHEGRFYHFVHEVHSKGSGLFDGLMHWIELFINFVRGADGVGSEEQRRGLGQVDLEICMPAGGAERRAALAEIDAVIVHAYRVKMVRELKLSRRLANKEVEGAAGKLMGSSELDDQAFVAAMVDNLGVGNAFTGEMEDVEADLEDEEGSDEENDEREDRFDDARASFDETSESDAGSEAQHAPDAGVSRWRPPPPGRSFSQLTARPDKELPELPPADTAPQTPARKPRPPKAPTLVVLPEMVPLFTELVRPMLRPARSASASSFSAPPTPGGFGSEAAAARESGSHHSSSPPAPPAPAGGGYEPRRRTPSAQQQQGSAAPPGAWGF
ncbi:hypothetical protein FA09DRAFT_329956 [Tilletiopsis washingtonensis]|uniref:PX domain-containing protein n=1 Tax=Tilletiopsis washingtonensis TaxID=58919 RepID=A0A316Z7P2_9BASI|nr:hypothetical protein FA09DRAFT_329956 [Tilletiopsis washingtonensis]PWN97790.1 hypothetical protein FA09DRAFT_329956 [Tilletiopsis washingtonensis]